MPIVNPDAAIAQAASASESRNKRRAARQGGKTEEPETAPLPAQKMLNLPNATQIGALSLVLTAPVIDKAAEVHNDIYTKWPDVLIFAAAGDLAGKGVNVQVIAEAWGGQRQRYHEALIAAGETGAPVPSAVTVDEVRVALSQLGMRISDILPDLCDTLWPIASDTPGLHWPPPPVAEGEDRPAAPSGGRWLDDAIRQSLSIPQLADLLRAILSALGGFPGDVGDRF